MTMDEAACRSLLNMHVTIDLLEFMERHLSSLGSNLQTGPEMTHRSFGDACGL